MWSVLTVALVSATAELSLCEVVLTSIFYQQLLFYEVVVFHPLLIIFNWKWACHGRVL